MVFEDIAIVFKESELEFQRRLRSASTDTIKRLYRSKSWTADLDILQQEATDLRNVILETFPGATGYLHPNPQDTDIPAKEDLPRFTKEVAERSRAVVVCAGDDIFKLCSHYLNGTPIAGVTVGSKSIGALNNFSLDNIESLERILRSRNLEGKLELWTRLKARVGNKTLPAAVSEIYVGTNDPTDMTKVEIIPGPVMSDEQLETALSSSWDDDVIKEEGEVAYGSSIMIATRAGSTGQYDASGGQVYEFEKGDKNAMWSVINPYSRRLQGVIDSKHQLNLRMKTHNPSFVRVDSVKGHDIELDFGDTVMVSVHEYLLHVIAQPLIIESTTRSKGDESVSRVDTTTGHVSDLTPK